MKKVAFLSLAFFAAGLVLGNAAPAAEKYPVKPIECIVAVEAGGDGDVIHRPIMQKVSEILGQPIMIVNKPGGGSSIGYREIYRAKPDGYTVGWGSATLTSNKLQGISPIDYHDFTLLGGYAVYFPVIVASSSTKQPFKTIQEVIAYAKAHPGDLSMAVSGIGGSWWVSAMSFLKGTGLDINTIPQSGTTAAAMGQVAGGHIDLAVVALGAAKPMIDAGKVRLLATLGDQRAAPPYDQIPTIRELGYDVSYESTNFAMGPPKMPKEIVALWVKAVKQAAEEPNFRQFLQQRNARPGYISPEDLVPLLDKRRVFVREIMSKAGILKESK